LEVALPIRPSRRYVPTHNIYNPNSLKSKDPYNQFNPVIPHLHSLDPVTIPSEENPGKHHTIPHHSTPSFLLPPSSSLSYFPRGNLVHDKTLIGSELFTDFGIGIGIGIARMGDGGWWRCMLYIVLGERRGV